MITVSLTKCMASGNLSYSGKLLRVYRSNSYVSLIAHNLAGLDIVTVYSDSTLFCKLQTTFWELATRSI